MNLGVAFYLEVIATFFLAFVVLQVATAQAMVGNSIFGLAIGFTVTAMASAAGGITGGALNPAVALLGIPGFFNTNATTPWAAIFLVYWVACPIGGALAAGCFRLTNAKECSGSSGPNEKTPLADAA